MAQGADVLKQRQDLMGATNKNWGPIGKVMRGEEPNVASAAEAAMAISAQAKGISALFPAGTGLDAKPDSTRAKPEIWAQRAEFDAAANKLVEEAAKLSDVAKTNNLDAFKTQFAAFRTACIGCHEGPPKAGGKFRVEEK
ncbi:MAG: cytochrome c [Alphaproteobacteria bacterium]|nr:cytochrome c [Alphaproteobacteria bacterium]